MLKTNFLNPLTLDPDILCWIWVELYSEVLIYHYVILTFIGSTFMPHQSMTIVQQLLY